MTEVRIGVVGCAGRMGRALVRHIAATAGCRLAAATEAAGHRAIGSDPGEVAGIGATGLVIGDDTDGLFAASDAVLDFTTPGAALTHAALAAQTRTPLIIGTTGLTDDQRAGLRVAALRTAIVWAPNMSLGVNLVAALTRWVAATLDHDFDIEIVEMHHRDKVDAPSGTALLLGRAAAEGRGVTLADVAARGRDGVTGARRRGDIGFASLRGGDVVGDHTVIFAADGERIELTHRAGDRSIFARGAVRAALWAVSAGPGFYGMGDVLGLAGPGAAPSPG